MIAASLRLALGTTVALGFARFGYGLVLPAMRVELGWNLAEAGLLTTANGLGYLLGAATAATAVRRWGSTGTFRSGMAVCSLSLAATAIGGGFGVVAAARVVAGFGGALVFVTGGVIAARNAERTGSTLPIAVYFAGTGVGIAVSGILIPALLAGAPGRWPLAWLVLAAASAVSTAASWGAARTTDPLPAPRGERSRRSLAPLWRPAVAYLLFAAGYIAYITFLSTTLVGRGAGSVEVAFTWALLGAAVVAAPWMWRGVSAASPPGRVLAMLLAVITAASCLALVNSGGPAVALASATAYGAAFMAVPATVTALVRSATPPEDWSRALGSFTVLFAVGQTAGPWVAGAIADRTGPNAPLVWTAALCALGALVAAGGSADRPALAERA
ncbi:YbfB/YjiJ family MFS transporter [Embleya sp. NPDC050493]|uniref:YbfB/YjiJ family MFS transporter n=1 Tax=Embleya sp. NPDC050493 TaxID=3363989 RepID=UPI0037A30C47